MKSKIISELKHELGFPRTRGEIAAQEQITIFRQALAVSREPQVPRNRGEVAAQEQIRGQFTELPKHGYRCIGIDLMGIEIVTFIMTALDDIKDISKDLLYDSTVPELAGIVHKPILLEDLSRLTRNRR